MPMSFLRYIVNFYHKFRQSANDVMMSLWLLIYLSCGFILGLEVFLNDEAYWNIDGRG